MSTVIRQFVGASGMLVQQLHAKPGYLSAMYLDLSIVNSEEYIEFLTTAGDMLVEGRTGRMLVDFTKMANFSLKLRLIAITYFHHLIIRRVPYLVIAIANNTPLGITDQETGAMIKTAGRLNKKFRAIRMFHDLEDARQWLVDFEVGAEWDVSSQFI